MSDPAATNSMESHTLDLPPLKARPFRLLRWILAIVGCAGLMTLLSWLPGHLVMQQVDAFETRSIEGDLSRVAGGLRGELLILDDLCRDWSDWDDLYLFAKDQNAAFKKANLGWDSLLATTRIQLLVVADSQGGITWGDFRTDPETAHPLPDLFTQGRPLPRKNGFLLTPQGPMLVAMRPILQSNGTGPTRGTLVMGRLLDASSLERIRLREKLPLEIRDTRLHGSDPTLVKLRSSRNSEGLLVELEPHRALAHALLPDMERKGAIWLTVTLPRSIHVQGLRAAWTVSMSILGVLTLTGAILLWGFMLYRNSVRQHESQLQSLVASRTADLQRANRALEEASMVDPLTGLRNRRYAELSLPEDAAQAIRLQHPNQGESAKEDLVFFILDLDHFKEVNDRYGHAAGDAVLRQVGDLLRRVCRASDMAVRWGGEEFLVATRRTTRVHAAATARHILSAFHDYEFHLPGKGTATLTCSIGYCPFPVITGQPTALSTDQAIILADLCMYAAKRSGRNRWVGFLPPPNLDPRRLLEVFPRGFIHLAKSGILNIQTSHDDPEKLTWV